MRKIGSQLRVTLAESEYELVEYLGGGSIILYNTICDHKELWQVNDHVASYCLQVGRWGYEFCHTLTD